MNFRQQAEQFMSEIANSKSDPVKASTLRKYRSLLNARILPVIGEVEMPDVNNKTAKLLAGRLAEAQLSPRHINSAVSLVKQIVKSAVDDEGNQLYPRTWNTRFIDAPRPDSTPLKAPVTPVQTLTEAISRTKGEVQALIALLGGTGLRIGEALALMVGPDDGLNSFWLPEAGTLVIRTTIDDKGNTQYSTKTKAGTRIVDLDPHLASFLRTQLGNIQGRMFKTKYRTFLRRLAAQSIPGTHSIRRGRITHLQGNSVPTALVKFWAGHAAGDVTERYTKFGSDVETRKVWSEKAGLGFQL